MASSFYPPYPPSLTPEQQSYLTTTIKDWSISHGLAVRPAPSFFHKSSDTANKDGAGKSSPDPNMALATTAPVTLFPSLFPRKCFDEALAIQTAYNQLYASIAMDEAWLGGIVEELLGIDDFIANLWNVHLAVKREGYAQDLSLGLFRSDYMVHLDPTETRPSPTIRQVEFNTIASSFGGLSGRVSSLHKYLLQTDSYPIEAASTISADSLPNSPSIEKLAEGLKKAHQAYGASKSAPAKPLCILFLVQDPERNTFDQKHIEFALQRESSATVFRIPFSRVIDDTTVDENTRALIYTPPAFPDRHYEATTIYIRAGYSPTEYVDSTVSGSSTSTGSTSSQDPITWPRAWQARLHLERSAAIKCPSILTHLAGSKKIQQILATPSSPHLAKFLPHESMAARVRHTFAPMYPLDSSHAGLEARKIALDEETASRFVLKPQREGGGNNIYRRRITGFLKEQDEREWPQYVLMEMIETPAQRNAILRDGECMEGGVICELGVYGTCLWRNPSAATGAGGKVLENDEAGYLLRTKGDTSEEGGVAAGFGAVDSACLVDV